MSPAEYKKQLKNLFASLNPQMSEAEKLRRVDAFRRQKGIQKHIKQF